MTDPRRLREIVRKWRGAGRDEEWKSRELIESLLERAVQPYARNHFTPGHITCTAAVLNPTLDKALLVHHRRLDRWLLPGGHVETDDSNVWDGASREAVEETGVVLTPRKAPLLAGMDVHGIPGKRNEPYHLHHDLIWGFVASREKVRVTEETRDVRWVAIDDGAFDRYSIPQSIRRAVRAVLKAQ